MLRAMLSMGVYDGASTAGDEDMALPARDAVAFFSFFSFLENGFLFSTKNKDLSPFGY